MVGGCVLFLVLMQAPIGPVPEGFGTEGVLRSTSHQRRVLEAVLPSNALRPFVFTDSGGRKTRLELSVPGSRGEAVLDLTGTRVEWPGIGADQPFDVRATATQVTFTFVFGSRQTLHFNFTGRIDVKGDTATLSLLNGPSYFVTVEGPSTWTGFRLDVGGPLQQAVVHVGLMVTRQQHPDAETPPAAWGAAMAWDERNQRLVRYGGTDSTYDLPSDTYSDPDPDLRTWVFDDHVGWRSLALPNPGERVRPAMAWDDRRGVMVLFGGASETFFASDTWELSDAGWRQTFAFGPQTRWAHAMSYDRIRQRSVLVGGSRHTATFDESWDWDGNLWSSLSTQPGRRDALGLAWDENLQALLLFGGWRYNFTLSDTWALQSGTWTQLTPVTSPPPRSSLAMAWDPVRRQVIMTGGWQPGGALFRDTWAFDGTTWTQLADAPQPWFRHVLASHPRLGVVGFGGDGDGGPMADTWYLADAGWLRVPLTAAEGPCFFDAVGQRVGRIMDRSVWTLGPLEWERTRDFPANDVTHVARTADGVIAISPTTTWLDPLDGGPIEAIVAGAQPEAFSLVWDEVLARLWLLTPAGELFTLTDMGWDLRAVLGSRVRALAAAPDGGLLVLGTDVEHYDPSTGTYAYLAPAPPSSPGPTTLFFDQRRGFVIAVMQESRPRIAEWDGTQWSQIETPHLPLEFFGVRDGGTPIARGGDGDAIIDYEQLRSLGARCGEGLQCASGFCADGRCCESACSQQGDCLACSLAAGGQEDGRCTAIRAGFEKICATSPPCFEAVCIAGDPICPSLNDWRCPVDSGTPRPRPDAGRPVIEPEPSPPAGCGCTSWPDALIACVLALVVRRRRALRATWVVELAPRAQSQVTFGYELSTAPGVQGLG